MTALRYSYCMKCRDLLEFCECKESKPIECVYNFMMRKEPVPANHPFWDRHSASFIRKES